MTNVNVTPGASSITINVAGDYRVEFFVLLQSTTGAFDLTLGVEINGVFSETALVTATVIDTDFEVITLSAIVTLAAGDVLTLAVSSVAGGTLLFGPSTNANLSAIRLGS